jgi:hypothetical protein
MARKKFATKVDADLLKKISALAEEEDCYLQDLVEEALNDLLAKHGKASPRAHVIAAYSRSHKQFGKLYKKLAK